MAVTRIKAYHTESSMHNGLSYSADPEKTNIYLKAVEKSADHSEEDNLGTTPFQGNVNKQSDLPNLNLSRVFSYTVNPDKTHISADGDMDILVSGHHCNPDLAEIDFKRCRSLYYMNGHKEHTGFAKAKRPMRAVIGKDGKPLLDNEGQMIYDEKAPVYRDPDTGKVMYQEYKKKKESRTAYMWVMSFPGKKELGYEIDPRLVHEIGREFCREYLDDYACTVSTHVNTEHYHNHIMQCAYSLDGTHKYRDTMEALAKARDISDDLSLRFGIPIILSPQTDRGISWFEWKKKHDGQSWKQQMRRDIRESASIADNTTDFRRLMEAIGYQVRETENHFSFTMPGAGEPGIGYRCRDSRLNSSDDNFDYTKTGIQSAIERRTGKQITPIMTSADHTPETIIDLRHRGNLRHYATHIYISRYTIDGRRRTALEILFIEALKVITLLRDLFLPKDPPSDHPVFLSHEKKIRLMEESLAMVQKLKLENRESLSDLISQTGMELSRLKKQYKNSEPVYKQEKSMLDKIDEARELIGVIGNYGIAVTGLELYCYGDKDIRKHRAELMPMTPLQRRDLYLALSDSPVFRLRCKYDELTFREAQEVIDFLKKGTGEQPQMLYDITDKNSSKVPETLPLSDSEDERRSRDTFFLSRLADYPLEKQMRIDRCRELLNELGSVGITPDDLQTAGSELKASIAAFDEIKRKMDLVSDRYRELKKLEYNIALASNTRFTHGPLFDESTEKAIEKSIVDNVDQLHPEDRADEEKHRYDFRER